MRTLNFVIVLIVFTSFVVASEPLRSTDILDFYPYTIELSIGETYQANYKFNFNHAHNNRYHLNCSLAYWFLRFSCTGELHPCSSCHCYHYHLKCANALLASAILCVSSRFFITAPSPL